jgi:CRP-like cAMP-binding protein
MAVTLAEAKARARAFVAAGEPTAALLTLDHILAAQPLDDDVRLEIADLLAHTGKPSEAAEIYRALSLHFLRAGRPLPALVAAAALVPLGQSDDSLLNALAEMYAAGAPKLGQFGARPAPLDPAAPIPDPPTDLGGIGSEGLDEAVPRTVARALDLSAHAPHQEQVHPIPFLSELEGDSLRAVLRTLQVRKFDSGMEVVRQGEPGTSLYLVATGQLRVTTTLATGGPRELARLHENSLFGEMALVTSQPRGASVIAVEPATVLELDRTALDRVRAELPSIEVALGRFTRERLIRNLLATSPLFTPFTREQQKQLLERFEGIEVETGTTVIRQGEAGLGLYIVLTGALEVVTQAAAGESEVPLGQLQLGDIFGEMSLVTDLPTSATVRSTSACTLLFLARVYFDRLTEAVPELKGYFAGLAERRASDNSVRVNAAALPEETINAEDIEVLF